ncbi:spore coat protein, partial [Micrococcus sp. SIMBA_144]
ENEGKVYRGSEKDVLSRYFHAASAHKVDVIVRITSDCPLIDPHVIDDIITYYLDLECDLVTNAGSDLSQRTYPRGLDTEVFSFDSLEAAFLNAKEDYHREHVT